MGKYNEKKAKKKLRAMTYGEFCRSIDDCDECPLKFEKCGFKSLPCKPYGKYIFIEAKE